MTAARIVSFHTEYESHEHGAQLKNGLHPEVSVMDVNGVSVPACRTAPGGDGWGSAYYAPCEAGFIHRRNRSRCSERTDTSRKPAFPVVGLAAVYG